MDVDLKVAKVRVRRRERRYENQRDLFDFLVSEGVYGTIEWTIDGVDFSVEDTYVLELLFDCYFCLFLLLNGKRQTISQIPEYGAVFVFDRNQEFVEVKMIDAGNVILKARASIYELADSLHEEIKKLIQFIEEEYAMSFKKYASMSINIFEEITTV